MIKETDNAVFILGGVRLCIPSIWGIHFLEIKDKTTSNILSRNALSNKTSMSPYLIGSTLVPSNNLNLPLLESGPLQKIRISNLFEIRFIIPHLNEGEALNNVLMPLLKNMRIVIDVPSQFIWNGFYMALGFLKDYTATFHPGTDCYEYKLIFSELLYSFSDSLSTLLVPNSSKSVILDTAPII